MKRALATIVCICAISGGLASCSEEDARISDTSDPSDVSGQFSDTGADGDADAPTWPSPTHTHSAGSGIRGGAFDLTSVYLAISWRSQGARQDGSRRANSGFRGVRTAP